MRRGGAKRPGRGPTGALAWLVEGLEGVRSVSPLTSATETTDSTSYRLSVTTTPPTPTSTTAAMLLVPAPPSHATITTLDSAGNVGLYPSITSGADGLGLISYYDVTGTVISLAGGKR